MSPTSHFLRAALVSAALALAASACATPQTRQDLAVPRYDHIFVIVEENKDYGQILDPAAAPNIAGLAAKYGNATQFYSEVHPSEANYVAILGGDTFGIHDDDAWYCGPGSTRQFCDGAKATGYADHTVHALHLGDQLVAKGLTWKGYYEDLPEPGSLAVIASSPTISDGTKSTALYASKHSGFVNFADVQTDPQRKTRIVGFDQFDRDLNAGDLPNFALIVPNQCNEMHGLYGAKVPADCNALNKAGLIRRGDAEVGMLVKRIQLSPIWQGNGNVAIIITFDEGSGGSKGGCCGTVPGSVANYGGGHIPTVVVTNHGPRGVADDTPYDHYSLLRTMEDAFGLSEHLAHAAETDKGVVPMVKLFEVKAP
jgi:phosphatidylinositol-3-phosphatase